MNLIENYDSLKTVNKLNGNFDEIVFLTKDTVEIALNKPDSILEIYQLIDDLEKNPNNEDFSILLGNYYSLDEFEQEDILIYLIENGISITPEFISQTNIDTSKYPIDLFVDGIINGGNDLFFSDSLLDFIDLYKDNQELMLRLADEGILEIYNYLLRKFSLKKIDADKTDTVMDKFEEYFKNKKTYNKIIYMSIYDWDILLSNIFSDNVKAKERLVGIFKLNEKEKNELEIIKKEFMNDEYNYEVTEFEKNLVTSDYSILSKINFSNDDDLSKNSTQLELAIMNLGIMKNHGNKFRINFISLGGRVNSLLYTNNIDDLFEVENSFDDINEINTEVHNLLGDYIDQLNSNNLDFTIIISKSNGNKDGTDNEGFNNENYSGKLLKIA